MNDVLFMSKQKTIDNSAGLINVTRDPSGTITGRSINTSNPNMGILFSDQNESLVKSMDYVIGSNTDNPADRKVVNLNDPSLHYLTSARAGATALVISAARETGKLRDFAVVFSEPPTSVTGSPFSVNFRTTDSNNNPLTFKGAFIVPEASSTGNTDYIYYLTEIENNVFVVVGKKLETVSQS